ncbi:universal stress protein [Profundibacterium mesophilum]|uniref:Osmosensitive K+ channel histidine kinase Signal transduction n=1 Tax=Profundibacterium mesophilum KAUST100406-0324 TaxID=1037889 RepID=A0A921TCN2_9RHOB|nr:universal stress protein [Profundibacterium mesophilum]KAF0675868.1 Osmosensitive K+ channel histidine kinase Signal transduction [Profundibacterium mesophilum KAUST100406-0324]
MPARLIVGIDGHPSGERALDFAVTQARLIGECDLVVAYIIEWSPYAFQTAEENAQRHRRREEEISTVQTRVITPAVERLSKEGLAATGIVRHGDVADALNTIAREQGATQIIVARASEGGFSKRIFGSSTHNLVRGADVPVTVVK